jgi:hypothetical protein
MILTRDARARTPNFPDRNRALIRFKQAAAELPPSPELEVILRGAGWRGPIDSQLTALHLLGNALRLGGGILGWGDRRDPRPADPCSR